MGTVHGPKPAHLVRLRALARVTDGLAHGFANLPNEVLALCDLLRSGATVPASRLDRLDEAVAASAGVLHTVRTLTAPRERLLERVDAVLLARRAVAFATGARDGFRPGTLRLHEPGVEIPVVVPAADALAALWTLFVHVATGCEGPVDVTVERDGPRATVSVRGTGDAGHDVGLRSWIAAPRFDFPTPVIDGFTGDAAAFASAFPTLIAAGAA